MLVENDDEALKNILVDFHAQLAKAEEEQRLAGYIDDRMFELQEKEPGLAALLQHMLAQLPDGEELQQLPAEAVSDAAGHLLFCLAYTVYKAMKQSGGIGTAG
jgi:hypothetical protein